MWIHKRSSPPKSKLDFGDRVDVICDCCGVSCLKNQPIPHYKTRTTESARFEAYWGGRKRSDIKGDLWHCDLCENCALKVKKFIESIGGKVLIGYDGTGKITDPPCFITYKS